MIGEYEIRQIERIRRMIVELLGAESERLKVWCRGQKMDKERLKNASWETEMQHGDAVQLGDHHLYFLGHGFIGVPTVCFHSESGSLGETNHLLRGLRIGKKEWSPKFCASQCD